MSRPKTRRAARVLAAAVTLAAVLTGCSDIYYDRRDTIALGGGDAIAANAVTQMVDPWPAQSGNVNIAANGQKIQSAVERYRTNKVIAPTDPMTLEAASQQPTAAAAQTSTQTTTPNGNPSSTTTTSTQVSAQ